jgi:murein DD-endopeptidase MepM/ murein hydrolase activator NlpD
VVLALSLLLLVPNGGADPGTRKREIDSRIASLQDRIANARSHEGALTSEISAVTSKIRVLQDDVASASSQLSKLEAVLAVQQRKLDRLNDLFALQTRRLTFLRDEYDVALQRLNERLVEIYTEETPDTLSFVLSASSFNELLDQIEFVNEIGRQDERVLSQVRIAKSAMHAARERTKRTRARVAATTRVIADRTDEQRAVRDRLVASRDALASVRSLKSRALASTRESKADYLHEVEGLQAQSAALAARIQAGQRSSSGSSAPHLSSSGWLWPVNGPVTSGFGYRWGRMHQGIDIAVPTGTPVRAANSGIVLLAGWVGGYGNLVVIDHGGGIATAYGHNSGLAVNIGQSVSQGQVIAYSGSTGHSTGPHVHFEVRINGAPVDPLGYL